MKIEKGEQQKYFQILQVKQQSFFFKLIDLGKESWEGGVTIKQIERMIFLVKGKKWEMKYLFGC